MSHIEESIAVIGLGYVGLPLAVALSRHADVTGYDINLRRVEGLNRGIDSTNEVAPGELMGGRLRVSSDPALLAGKTLYIVTVPTPIDNASRPDFGAMLKACEVVGPVLSPGAIVVFESTVYPGATEEICGPALERASGLMCGVDFKLGYSPERINPGDKEHPLEKIVKVVAGQDPATLGRLCAVYGAIVDAGVHRAPSIKVAEAAKVLENTQRDVNIALMNEVSKICELVGIRSRDVLAAAGTKWNFLDFRPGLVGGHCIGVDPYYLTAKAEELGYRPEVILSGRRVNDSMGAYVAQRVIKLLAHHDLPLKALRVGIMGLTFKENVPDTRNSKVVDIVRELTSFGLEPLVHDPLADPQAVTEGYGLEVSSLERFHDLHALILAVPHAAYRPFDPAKLGRMIASRGIFVDIKSVVEPGSLRADIGYWSL
ncbi:MAG: UDP-glucose 6-dehydrogenase [uncultured Sphingomonas sp.]|uniref:UDP-glucose 6-dehydrogenase n=1 Tax=uncultured Sphingomonas sp. TaxID=158754 RepID=A0A6J4T566_9SPHN|nr:nucleotide sugar dehydrogenase [uncultured Sphingomonas sp.]CAA9513525.1 MAG: UDP-glucose 6-dehydrogenase [uncultured Sphingomonas sp.]